MKSTIISSVRLSGTDYDLQKSNFKSAGKKTFGSIGKVMLLATSIAFVSCSKDDDAAPVVPIESQYYVKAKVDDGNYANSAYAAPAATLNAGTLMIQSSGDTGNSMQIQIPNYAGEGTYQSGSNDLSSGYINFSRLGAGFTYKSYTSVRGTGTVEITSVSATEIEGTFTAYAPENEEDWTEAVQITEGTFKLKKP